ncbi:MAG: CapA family protein [bacterium]
MKNSTKSMVLAIIIIAAIVATFVATWLVIRGRHETARPRIGVSVFIDPSISADENKVYLDSIIDSLGKADYAITQSSNSNADIVVSNTNSAGYQALVSEPIGSPMALVGPQIIEPAQKPTSYIKLSTDLSDKLPLIKEKLKQTLKAPTPWSLTVAGDIIIGRTVYQQEAKLGDYTSSFTKVKDLLSAADYTVANAEWTAADGIAYPLQGMSFASPTKSLDGLTYAGIDAVSLANNHSMNGGVLAFEQMLASLTSLGIGYFGAGKSYSQAHTPYIADVKGIKVAFLGYTAIPGNFEAGPSSTGNAFIKIAPWYPFNESSIAQMEIDIKTAKTKADVVIPFFHWSEEYVHTPNEQMRQVAHRAVEAGATMVVASHPHWVQGIEWYKDTLIAYSLGNFVFDQEQSLKTKQGVVLLTEFAGNKLTKASFTPIQIENYYQQHILDGAPGQEVLNNIYTHSYWKN